MNVTIETVVDAIYPMWIKARDTDDPEQWDACWTIVDHELGGILELLGVADGRVWLELHDSIKLLQDICYLRRSVLTQYQRPGRADTPAFLRRQAD